MPVVPLAPVMPPDDYDESDLLEEIPLLLKAFKSSAALF